MFVTPQEIEVWYVLPTIRAELAKNMLKKGLKQAEIGRILGVTRAAVNQYIKQKRASKVVFSEDIQEQIIKSAEVLKNNPKCIVNELQRITHYIRKTKDLCKIHHKYCDMEIPDKCKACIEE